jgi:hypothetical protein
VPHVKGGALCACARRGQHDPDARIARRFRRWWVGVMAGRLSGRSLHSIKKSAAWAGDVRTGNFPIVQKFEGKLSLFTLPQWRTNSELPRRRVGLQHQWRTGGSASAC